MTDLINALLTSKKFIATGMAVGVGVWGRQRGVPIDEMLKLTAPLMVYVAAQGAADIGKEAKKVEASS